MTNDLCTARKRKFNATYFGADTLTAFHYSYDLQYTYLHGWSCKVPAVFVSILPKFIDVDVSHWENLTNC